MSAVDTEVRLAVPGAFSIPDLTGGIVSSVRPEQPLAIETSYWDTEDRRLARHGVTLRRRDGEPEGPRWTLTLPMLDGPPSARRRALVPREIELEGRTDRVPAAAADLVTAYARTAPLREVATLRTRRRRSSLLDATGAVVATLVDDEVSVMDGEAAISRFRELEVDGRALGPRDLRRVGERLRAGGAVDAEPIPRAIRALGPSATGPADAVAPAMGPDLPAGAAVRAALTAAVDRLVAHDAGMRLGDPEALHQARVALRTLRSHLRTFATLIDRRWSNGVVAELRAMADAIGPVRDLDVLVERLEADAHDLHPMIDPIFEELVARRDRARAAMLDRLRDERYASLLERLVAAAAAPRLVKAAARPAGEVLPPIARESRRRLRARARGVADRASDAASVDLHRARIAAKRARYAAEAIAPALAPDGRAAAERSARALSRLQDALGAVQDAFVAREEILAAAARRADEGPFNLAAGTLLERQARAGAEAREAVGPAWRRASRRRHRRWTR